MMSKTLFFLAAAGLAAEVAAAAHQHGHQHVHEKRAFVTEMTTVTNWVTVTLVENNNKAVETGKKFYTRKKTRRPLTTSTTSTTSSAAPVLPTEVPTTLIVETKAAVPSAAPEVKTPDQPPAQPPAQPSTPAPPPSNPNPAPEPAPPKPAPAPPAVHASGGNRRGLAYNDPQLLTRFLQNGNKVGWCYNWGQVDDSGRKDLEFVPTLWGTTKGFPATWRENAQKAIDAGSKYLFSFNEPDNDGQANLSPEEAARAHIELMGPFAGKAQIGSPSISNSDKPNENYRWLDRFFQACNGACPVDFINIHIYGIPVDQFFAHLDLIYSKYKKPIWITEFGFSGSEEEVARTLETVLERLEGGSYNFVERYAYFFAADGFMVKGNSLSAYGNTFAYGA